MQLWLFAWAPLNQKGLDVSMGYFLLPMVMVLLGRLFYGERLSRVQTMAVLVAAVGVSHELWRSGSFSWATALVIFGYPPYRPGERRVGEGCGSSCISWWWPDH